jgi:Glycosyltransferase
LGPGDRAAARATLGLGDLEGRGLVVCAARLEAVKGVDVLVDTTPALPGTVLAVAADGSERAAQERRAEARAPGRVRFLGRVDDMPTLWRAGDVAALPSRAEGLPLALLEAQASGLPAVATAVGGMPDAVDPATGAVVPPEDPAALAAALASRLAAPPGVSPRDFVARTYALGPMMDAYARLWSGEAP